MMAAKTRKLMKIMILVMMVILVTMLIFNHLPLLLCSDKGVLILVLVQDGDLVIQNLVVHPYD